MCDCEGGLFQILTQSFWIFSLRGETDNVWEEDSETGEMADEDDDDDREGFPEPTMCVHGNVKYMDNWLRRSENPVILRLKCLKFETTTQRLTDSQW